MPSGPPEQSQVQRVIQRMQKKDPYRIFAEVPSEEMVSALLQVTALSPQDLARTARALAYCAPYAWLLSGTCIQEAGKLTVRSVA